MGREVVGSVAKELGMVGSREAVVVDMAVRAVRVDTEDSSLNKEEEDTAKAPVPPTAAVLSTAVSPPTSPPRTITPPNTTVAMTPNSTKTQPPV